MRACAKSSAVQSYPKRVDVSSAFDRASNSLESALNGEEAYKSLSAPIGPSP
jgi:hypothetical protein|tara:strand:- start:600 stop:755 length:156 start_codon:yes stop_codon:yes gene_type:complete